MSRLTLIWDYTWRFGLYGLGLGALFGAAFGIVAGIRDPMLTFGGGLILGACLGAFFGGGSGLVMGIGTGLVIGSITLMFFHPRLTPAQRPALLISAFVTAFALGAFVVKLLLFGVSPSVDWPLVFGLATAGGIGAAFAAWRISLRAAPVADIA